MPTVEWLGLTIAEPVTMLTDFAITAVAWWMAWCLLRDAIMRTVRARVYWAAAFVFIGLGALLGGISHGFAPYLDTSAQAFVWKATVYALGLSSFSALAGTIAGTPLHILVAGFLQLVNVAALGFYGWWMIDHDDFRFVIYHYAPSMLLVALLQLLALAAERAPSAPWIIGGVIVTFAGAAIQQSGFGLHVHFNHNDIFHLVQIVGLVLFYRGVRRLDFA